MAFKFLGQRQLGKLPSRWVSTILMVAIGSSDFPGVSSSAEDDQRRCLWTPQAFEKA